MTMKGVWSPRYLLTCVSNACLMIGFMDNRPIGTVGSGMPL